ncbi:DUF4064 domain-containing protein [Marinococcus halophilus]|uniref:DUF4064 domain-containing protein n=1 Tax=Marinococcus halophilus TaxID=1371 RepID=A0A510Y599_MARHA|nr:DUF4064 domain-containing protein [Marinococcus halophilus]OZT80446.1 DUF4064 domain-containing protein [Marinococcus halophilus]GEK58518.1 hypothetical protein MHA01_14230 [Marinococcus halophilus]
MVKRTAEKALGIIAAVLSGLGVILGIVFLFVDASALEEANQMVQEQGGETLNTQDMAAQFTAIGISLIIFSAIATILAVVGVFMLKRNKRAVASGILFFLAAIAGFIAVNIFAIVHFILLVVAGVMAIVRKPAEPTDNSSDVQEYPE